MADVSSYAWNADLNAPVELDGATDVPTPGFKNPEDFDTENAQVVRGNIVLRADQVVLEWEDDFSSVTLTNKSGEIWQPGENLYVTVKLLPEEGSEEIEGDISALDERVAAVEDAVQDHETRLAALETAVQGQETRIAALEAANPPARSAGAGLKPPVDKPRNR